MSVVNQIKTTISRLDEDTSVVLQKEFIKFEENISRVEGFDNFEIQLPNASGVKEIDISEITNLNTIFIESFYSADDTANNIAKGDPAMIDIILTDGVGAGHPIATSKYILVGNSRSAITFDDPVKIITGIQVENKNSQDVIVKITVSAGGA